MKYPVLNTFEEVHKQYEKLLKKLSIKLCLKYKRPLEEIEALVLNAAYQSWLYQQKQATDNKSPYAFGTYLNLNIKDQLRQFYHNPDKEFISLSDQEYSEHLTDKSFSEQENKWHNEHLQNAINKLGSRNRDIIQMLYWENASLGDCSQKLKLSVERIRQLEQEALHQLKRMLKGTYVK